MKIKRRIKLLFSCFRPRDGVVGYNDHDGIGAVKKRQRQEGKAGGMVVSGYGGKEESMVTFSSFSDDEITNKKKKKRSFRRSLSHVLDSIFSETSLSKKNGESRKPTDNSIRSSSNKSSSSSKLAKFFRSMKRKASSRKSSDTKEDVTRSNSSGSSSLFSSSAIGSASFSSSSTSSLASSSRSASDRGKSTLVDLKQVNNNNNNYTMPLNQATGGSDCYFSSNVGFCCLLIFVLVLMTWGKVFATICTCLCLLLAPTQFKGTHPRLNDVEMVDTDMEEYKKRVIMEGLLERKIFSKSFSSLQ